MDYDLIIIGGGPAGIAAALYAARQNMRFVMLAEQVGGLTNYVPDLKTYLGYYYLTGYELVEKFKEHMSHYKIPMRTTHALHVGRSGGMFVVKADDGTYRSRAVIVATGRRFKKLGVPGEEEYLGRGVSLCTACDGPLFKGKKVAVVGGGRSALFSTLFLVKLARKIVVISKEGRLMSHGGLKHLEDVIRGEKNVEVLLNSEVVEITGGKTATGVLLRQGGRRRAMKFDGVFVEVGYVPNSECVAGLARLNGRGEIIVDEEGRTSCRGLFAAGDVTHIKEKQVMVACGEGAKALLSALTYLEESGKKRKRASS